MIFLIWEFFLENYESERKVYKDHFYLENDIELLGILENWKKKHFFFIFYNSFNFIIPSDSM